VRATSGRPPAWADGKFADELVPVSVKQKKGDPVHLRPRRRLSPDASMESLGKLRADREGRRGHRRQRQPAERRRRRLSGGRRGQAGRAGPRTHRLVPQLGRGRLRPLAHGHRPGAGDVERLFKRTGLSAGATSGWSSSTRPSRRRCWPCLKGWGWDDQPPRAQRQRLGHLARPPDRRHRRPHPRQPDCAKCSAATCATAWKPCASAAARASRRCLKGPSASFETRS
jgi:hypothetical protein